MRLGIRIGCQRGEVGILYNLPSRAGNQNTGYWRLELEAGRLNLLVAHQAYPSGQEPDPYFTTVTIYVENNGMKVIS